MLLKKQEKLHELRIKIDLNTAIELEELKVVAQKNGFSLDIDNSLNMQLKKLISKAKVELEKLPTA